MRGVESRSRLVGLLLVLAAALCACAGIPGDGPVLAGRPVANDPREDVLRVVVRAPGIGDDPTEIVQGFLLAAAGFSEDHSVARSYLTPAEQMKWRPDVRAVVYPGLPGRRTVVSQTAVPTASTAPTTVQAPPTTTAVEVRVPVQAEVDSSGHYAAAPAGQERTEKFGLEKTAGQWRISSLQDGIIISRSDFDLTFRAFPLYFPDPRGAYLVPDLRWFPGSPETPTVLVRALLDGPSEWLAPAVSSGAPPGTRLAVGAVVLSGNLATVDLTSQVLAAKPRQRWLLKRAIADTLGRLRDVGSVQLTQQGAALSIDDQPGAATVITIDPPVDGRPIVVRRDGTLARVKNGRMSAVEGVESLQSVGATHPAISQDGKAVAVLSASGAAVLAQVVDLPPARRPLIEGEQLTAPSFDPQDWVWSSPAANRGKVMAAVPAGDVVTVDAPQLLGRRVESLRISRDGTRALITTREAGTAHVWVSAVRRDGEGRPTELSPGLSLVPDLVDVVEASWADDTSVVVLGTRRGMDEGPFAVQVGGRVNELPTLPGALGITAGNGALDLYAAASGGHLLVRAGEDWNPVGDARWPAFPG